MIIGRNVVLIRKRNINPPVSASPVGPVRTYFQFHVMSPSLPPPITSPELIQNNGHCGTTQSNLSHVAFLITDHHICWTSWLTVPLDFWNVIFSSLWWFSCKSSPTLLLWLCADAASALQKCQHKLIKTSLFPPRYQEKSGLLRTRLTCTCIHTPRCTFCTSPGYALNFDWWHSRWEFHIIRRAGTYLAEEIPARRRVPGKTWEFGRRTESTVDQKNYATTRSQGREGECPWLALFSYAYFE